MNKTTIAIAYDFDGTLAPGYMHDHSFFPSLGVQDPGEEFWEKTKQLARKHDMDEVLAYMHLMLWEANYRGLSIRSEKFEEHGKGMRFFPGVEEWFKRINEYGASQGVQIKHYIISSGLREMIRGTSIADEFSAIFASGYMYNQDDIAIWPALAVNYTNKTQYLFRINKGIENSWDNESLNKYWGETSRPVPGENIVYIGDGETDVPAMKMTRHINGHAIAVYDPEREGAKEKSDDRVDQDRAGYSFAANYEPASELEKTIQFIINDAHDRGS